MMIQHQYTIVSVCVSSHSGSHFAHGDKSNRQFGQRRSSLSHSPMQRRWKRCLHGRPQTASGFGFERSSAPSSNASRQILHSLQSLLAAVAAFTAVSALRSTPRALTCGGGFSRRCTAADRTGRDGTRCDGMAVRSDNSAYVASSSHSRSGRAR